MPKVAGIDFSALEHYREAATIRLLDGKELKLPLIKVRDSGIATALLQRNDILSVQFNTLQARLSMKKYSVQNIATGIKDGTPDSAELSSERGLDMVDDTMDVMNKMQQRIIELSKECNSLYDEIHEFLKPYLEGTGVLEQLDTLEHKYTIQVLMLMLEGEAALKATEGTVEEDSAENPTTQQSPKS